MCKFKALIIQILATWKDDQWDLVFRQLRMRLLLVVVDDLLSALRATHTTHHSTVDQSKKCSELFKCHTMTCLQRFLWIGPNRCFTKFAQSLFFLWNFKAGAFLWIFFIFCKRGSSRVGLVITGKTVTWSLLRFKLLIVSASLHCSNCQFK